MKKSKNDCMLPPYSDVCLDIFIIKTTTIQYDTIYDTNNKPVWLSLPANVFLTYFRYSYKPICCTMYLESVKVY